MHVVFSTKQRRPWIHSSWRQKLHEYLGGTTRGLGATAEAVGGIEDHIHLLVSYRPSLVISDFLRELKKSSSTWSAEHHEPRFSWQDGYAVFSVSASQAPAVVQYIQNQEEHHRHRTFRDELEQLLVRHGIEFRLNHLD